MFTTSVVAYPEFQHIGDDKNKNGIVEIINETVTDPAIIETCGHAIYIGRNTTLGKSRERI